jgi:hypothetical protein
MDYAVDMALYGMKYTPAFMMTGSGIQGYHFNNLRG